MNSEPFVIERILNAPVEKVWSAITNKDEMRQWYFHLAAFKPEVGFEFTFVGGPEGRQYTHRCVITEVMPGKKLSYSWSYDGYEGKSVVTFELFAEADKTRLRLTHTGLETFPASNPDFEKKNFVAGWTHIIGAALPGYFEN
ncbi:MAG TPA: SRPBCC domain-containing protein [Chitinophagales bacterium]|nr:SRPBCC domain-containing protein [Chitinophagales bacterium]